MEETNKAVTIIEFHTMMIYYFFSGIFIVRSKRSARHVRTRYDTIRQATHSTLQDSIAQHSTSQHILISHSRRAYPASSASNTLYVSYPLPGRVRTAAEPINTSAYVDGNILFLMTHRYLPVKYGCGKMLFIMTDIRVVATVLSTDMKEKESNGE